MSPMLLALAVCLSISLGAGGAWAGAAKVDPLTIKFAHAGSPTHPYSVGIQKLTPVLEKNSGGAIKLQVFCCAQLGSERELAEGTRLGTINMTSVAAEGALPAWVPELQALGLPFLIRDRAHAYKVLDGPIGKEFEAKLAAQGFQTLGWWELGFRNMTTKNKPIHTPTDLGGLKMRVQEAKVWLALMRSLGAIPTPIPFGELYNALQQGVVDGQENPIVTIVSMKFYEVQKQVGLTEHTYTALPVLANKPWWDGLTPAQREVIAESVRQSVLEQRQTVAAQVDEGIKFLKSQGVNITEVDKAKFMEATKDVPNLISDQVPPDLVRRIRDTK
ncbi:MAG TPA: TRAP transporter substrate-binding protein [Candidatus Acidoferrum sp.]|nr:TRAP transporter substrate-binding protein [Candidatus Acidoferrum sp.]